MRQLHARFSGDDGRPTSTHGQVRPFLAVLVALAPCVARAAPPVDCDAPPPSPLTLRDVDARVLDCNRDLRASVLAVDAARADVAVAGQGQNPTLELSAANLNPKYGVGAGPLKDKTFESTLRLEKVIERGGKLGLRTGQAQELYKAVQADRYEQARQQRLAARLAFFDLAAAQQKVRLQVEFESLAVRSAQAARRRFEAGEVARADADRFRLDAARASNDLRQAQLDLQRARLELARQLGAESRASSITVATDTVVMDSHRNEGERPDAAAARHRIGAAESARELARSIGTRDVTLGVQADHWPASATNTQGTGNSFGVSVSIPINVLHANEAEVLRANADLESARAAFARAQAQSLADLGAAEEESQAARERRDRLANDVLPAAREVAEAAEYSYSRGASGILDLLDARRSLKSVELDDVMARADAGKAWARREAAIEVVQGEVP